MSEEKYLAAIKFIKNNDNFLLTTHVNSDCDGIGSLAAMMDLLTALGKSFEAILPDPPQEKLAYIENFSKFKIYGDGSEKLNGFAAAIIIDSPNIERIGPVKNLLSNKLEILNIDHHVSNDLFGDTNLVLTDLAASAHAVAELYRHLNIVPGKNAAAALYSGICTDTGRFRFENTKADTLAIAGWLVDCGADPEYLAKVLFFQNKIETTMGLGKMLTTIKLHLNGKVATAYMDYDFLSSETGAKVDAEGFANWPLTIIGVETAFLLKEYEKGIWSTNLRSQNYVDVNKLATVFGGGGHPRASGAEITGTREEVEAKLLKEVEKFL